MAKENTSEATPPYQRPHDPGEIAGEVRAAQVDTDKPVLAIGDNVDVNGVGKPGSITAIFPDRIEVKFIHPANEHRLTALTTFGSYHPDRVTPVRRTAPPSTP